MAAIHKKGDGKVKLMQEEMKGTTKGTIYPRGDSPIKMMGVLIGNFEKNPYEVPESRLVGVAQIYFQP